MPNPDSPPPAPQISPGGSTPGVPTVPAGSSLGTLLNPGVTTQPTAQSGPANIGDLAKLLLGQTPQHTPPGTIMGPDGKSYYLVNGQMVQVGSLSPAEMQAAQNQHNQLLSTEGYDSKGNPYAIQTPKTNSMGSSSTGGVGGLNSTASTALAGLASGQSNADLQKQAADMINAQFQPLLDALTRQEKQDETVYGQQSAQVKADQARLDSNIQAIYGLLRNQIGELGKSTDAQFAQTEQGIGNNYDQLRAALNSTYGNAGAQLSGDLNQLGLQGAADNYGNHRLVDNYSLLSNLANVNQAATQGNLQAEGQGFHSLLANEGIQATATGNDRQSIVDQTALKELTALRNNLTNQLNSIAQQRIDINTEKGQQTTALYDKLQSTLAATNNQIAIEEARLQQGQQRIDLANSKFGEQLNNDTFNHQLALEKLAKMGSTAANNTKLGNAETTLGTYFSNPTEAGQAFDWLVQGKTAGGGDLLTLLATKGVGAIGTKDLQPEANALAQQYGTDPQVALAALQEALLALAGYGHP